MYINLENVKCNSEYIMCMLVCSLALSEYYDTMGAFSNKFFFFFTSMLVLMTKWIRNNIHNCCETITMTFFPLFISLSCAIYMFVLTIFRMKGLFIFSLQIQKYLFIMVPSITDIA